MVGADRLAGRYRIERVLSSELNVTICDATDESTGAPVRIVVGGDDAHDEERLARAARAAQALTHPNIAPVLDYGRDGRRLFLVSEGRDDTTTLRDALDEGESASRDFALRVARDIGDALAHAHAAGVIHGGLSPSLIDVGESGDVRVAGFGAEPLLGAGGSPYRSPESAAGRRLGAEADVYSFGVIVAELLGAAIPVDRGDLQRAVDETDEGPLPAALVPALLRATAPRPHDRFRSVQEFRAALENTPEARTKDETDTEKIAPEPTATWPLPADRYNAERLGRRVLIGFLVIALIAFGAFMWRLRNEAGDGRSAAGGLSATPTIPDAVGLDEQTAVRQLRDAGLTTEVRRVPSEGSPGVVLDQNPNAGTARPAGSRVILFVGREVGENPTGSATPPEPTGSP